MSAYPWHAGLPILGLSATGKKTDAAEVIELMQHGVTKEGKKITFEMLELFDLHSKKNLSDLVDELNNGEATLSIGPIGPWPNRVIRDATSVKFTIINPETHMWLKEITHSYKNSALFTLPPDSDKPTDSMTKLIKGERSGSETMIAGETEDETLVRGLEQELKLLPGEYAIVGYINYAMGEHPGFPNAHESNTYEHIYSREWIRADYTISTIKFGTNAPMIISDHGKTTLRVWVEGIPFDTNLTIAQLKELGFGFD